MVRRGGDAEERVGRRRWLLRVREGGATVVVFVGGGEVTCGSFGDYELGGDQCVPLAVVLPPSLARAPLSGAYKVAADQAARKLMKVVSR